LFGYFKKSKKDGVPQQIAAKQFLENAQSLAPFA